MASCSLDIPVENELTDPNALSTILSAQEDLATAYSTFPKVHSSLSILTDDFVPLGFARNDKTSMNLYNWSAYDLIIYTGNLWEEYYACILHINALLEREKMIREWLDEKQNKELDQTLAEAYTLKAMCYLELLQLFGTRYDDTTHPEGIILKEKSPMERLSRSSKAACVQEINTLLDLADIHFDKSVAIMPTHHRAIGFCSKETILGLRVRLALYLGDYRSVLTLLPDTPEAQVPKGAGDWGTASKSYGITAAYVLNTFYNDAYDSSPAAEQMKFGLNERYRYTAKDLRTPSYAVNISLYEDDMQVLGKYCLTRFERQEIRSAYLIRPQELLFARAEALARLGQEDQACKVVNGYLQSIHAPTIALSLRGDELIRAILDEKAKELVGENINYFDQKRSCRPLKRFGMYGTSISKVVPIDDYRWTFPIPASEYNSNPHLVQNEGWPTKKIREDQD